MQSTIWVGLLMLSYDKRESANPNSIRFYRKTLIHLDNKMRTLSMPQQDKDKKKKLDCTEIESTMLAVCTLQNK